MNGIRTRAMRLLGAACVVAGCDSVTDSPFEQPDARPIVYFAIDTGWALFSVPPLGGSPRRLSVAQTQLIFPALSPDGSRLAFVSGDGAGGVYVGAADGSGAERVYVGRPDHIAWSPDQTRVALGVDGEIVVVPLDGSATDTITAAVEVHASYPSWSSRERIAFTSRAPFSFSSDLYTIASDGSDLRLIVSVDGAEARDPAWSPDGSRLAFALGLHGGSAIFTVNPNGTDRRRLTPEPQWGFGSTDLAPTWAPSGRWIAFQREHLLCTGADCENRYDIMMVAVEGGVARNLTAEHAWGGAGPSW